MSLIINHYLEDDMEKYIYQVLSKRVPRRLKYKCRRDGDHYMILGKRGDSILTLNHSAFNILDKCDGCNTIADIHNQLLSFYTNVETDKLLSDIIYTIIDFEALSFITFRGNI